VLVDTGGTVAARIVAALDEHLVIAGLSRYVRVFDPSAFALPASIDDELIDGHVGAVSAAAFEFICTTGRLGEVRAFMGKLLTPWAAEEI
jgi:hypothetical protein